MRLGETRKEAEKEEEEERGSTLVQSVTSSRKWKRRFLDTTGKRLDNSDYKDYKILYSKSHATVFLHRLDS